MSPLININVNDLAMIKQVRHALNWILCGVSGFTLAAISVDRLLALSLGLRYRHVTLRRVRVAIICFWFIGLSLRSIRISRSNIALKAVSTLVCW